MYLKKNFFLSFFLLLSQGLFAFSSYEGKVVAKVNISIENAASSLEPKAILSRLKTQEGTPFSQLIFDSDLKALSEDFDRIEPDLQLKEGKIYLALHLWQRPLIREIQWKGNQKISSSTLQKELSIKSLTIFHRQEFHKALNKIKELYIKKGYFESQITYTTEPVASKNEILLIIDIKEGHSGNVANIVFQGFTKQEEKELREMMYTKRYNLFTSWLTETGIFRQEALEQDQMTLINYLHNKGYADASVEIKLQDEKKSGQVIVEVIAKKGPIYPIGNLCIEGNFLLSAEELRKFFLVKTGDPFSPQKFQETILALKTVYGKKGYIEAEIHYEATLREKECVYDVKFLIDEGECFTIGLIHVFGNKQTQTRVILRESLLVPGETFDSRKLKATQDRLQNIGYFKNVNVYAVRSTEDLGLEKNIRDVFIEVEETTTGHASLFAGLSSLDSIFGGLDLTEINFNIRGFAHLGSCEGLSALRGGGEKAQARINIGKKQTNYIVSWIDPYFQDTHWRFGADSSFTTSSLQSKDYLTKTLGFSIFASYPWTNFWTVGTKYRLRDGWTHLKHGKKNKLTKEEKREKRLEIGNGVISALCPFLSYDSTDNPYKTHRGLRSLWEIDCAVFGGRYRFFKYSQINAYYHPVPFIPKTTMKYRAEVRFIQSIHKGADHVPQNERLFLGGDNTVRGYKPFILGPKRKKKKNDPTGGISSALLSVECSKELHRAIDVFAFFDAGCVTLKRFELPKLNTSYGFGIRLELMNRVPFTFGLGFPINPDHKSDVKKFFFSMGGQF